MRMEANRDFENLSRRVMARSRAIVTKSLSRRERQLTSILNSYLPTDGTSEYAFIFALSYGCTSGKGFQRIEDMTAAINLLQASTFVIDDVLDESTTRYDEETIWSSHGTGLAVASGHVLEAIAVGAMHAAARKHFPRHLENILATANQISKDVYRGQVMDVSLSRSLGIRRVDYCQMIEHTTGNFFRQIARLGGQLGKRKEKDCEALARFAFCYGMALQITDDIVDIASSKIFTGKDYAVDLANRRPRLPMIIALEQAGDQERKRLKAFLRNETRQPDLPIVVSIIKKCGALEECVKIAKSYLNQAQATLRCIPRSRMRQHLGAMAGTLFQTQMLE